MSTPGNWQLMLLRNSRWITAGGMCLLLFGCGGPGPRTVTNPNLAAKVPAIEDAVRTHDHSVIPQLVKDLQSQDPAVRFYAFRGLRGLTGQTLGYEYYGSDDDRQAAVLRWKRWLGEQHLKWTP